MVSGSKLLGINTVNQTESNRRPNRLPPAISSSTPSNPTKWPSHSAPTSHSPSTTHHPSLSALAWASRNIISHRHRQLPPLSTKPLSSHHNRPMLPHPPLPLTARYCQTLHRGLQRNGGDRLTMKMTRPWRQGGRLPLPIDQYGNSGRRSCAKHH